MPPLKVDILVIDDALEAVALRGILESFGIEVRCHFIGNVKNLVSLLNGNEDLYDIVIISCHGDNRGMILPELHETLEKEMPYHQILKASDWSHFLKLRNQIVINTGCCLGNKSTAQGFIQNGASAYVGLKTEGEGSTVMYFVISLLYFYIYKSIPLPDAFLKAHSLTEPYLFGLYQTEGAST